jgi:hypothetical protein
MEDLKDTRNKSGKMIYTVVGLIVVAAIMVFVATNSKVAASQKGPKIVFKETVHDFGKVPRGPSLQYNFKFTNKGSGILKIEKVQPTCGCTGATVGEKTEYEKGESGEIKVEFQTQGREGPQEKSIIIETNDKDNATVTLKVKCDIDKNLEY